MHKLTFHTKCHNLNSNAHPVQIFCDMICVTGNAFNYYLYEKVQTQFLKSANVSGMLFRYIICPLFSSNGIFLHFQHYDTIYKFILFS